MPSVYTAVGYRPKVYKANWDHDVLVYGDSTATIVAYDSTEFVEAISKHETEERKKALSESSKTHWSADLSRDIFKNWKPYEWAMFFDGHPFVTTSKFVITPYSYPPPSGMSNTILAAVNRRFNEATPEIGKIVDAIEALNKLRRSLECANYRTHEGTKADIMKIAKDFDPDSEFYRDALQTVNMIEENHQLKIVSLTAQIEQAEKELEELLINA